MSAILRASGLHHERFAVKQILVADDKAGGRELIRAIMAHSGYTVIEAANGAEALACARASDPDLIILDIYMPGLDGFAVLTELRRDEKFKSTPVIALTACAMAGDDERANAAGFNIYLAKPISIAVLRKEMLRFLELKAASRAAGCAV